MGTHPIFESDFDCLTEKIFKMASGDAAVAAQTVWAMRTDKGFVAFEVDDAENVNVCFEEKKITFSCDQVEITAEGKRGAEKQRIHWLKVDFTRWKDEDDEETEDKLDQDFD